MLRRRSNLCYRGVDLDPGLLDLSDERRQFIGYAIQAVGQRSEFIASIELDPAGEVPVSHDLQGFGQSVERVGDRFREKPAVNAIVKARTRLSPSPFRVPHGARDLGRGTIGVSLVQPYKRRYAGAELVEGLVGCAC